MRADRLVSILLLLQANGRMSAGELAKRLEVSRRTVHRDLEALGIAGVPVVVDRGSTGGASLLQGYRTDLTGLSQRELESLLGFANPAAVADLGMSSARKSASRKLAVAAGSARTASLQQRVLIDGESWWRSSSTPEHLTRVQDALWSDRKLRLRYRRGEEHVVERVVDPYGLVSKRGVWYLLGAADSSFRVYRISRIEDAQLLDQTFERQAGFDLEAAWAACMADYRGGMPAQPLRVTVRPGAAHKGFVARVAGEYIVERQDDGVMVMEFAALEPAVATLAGFGAMVEVVAPVALRLRLAAVGRGLVDMYAGNS